MRIFIPAICLMCLAGCASKNPSAPGQAAAPMAQPVTPTVTSRGLAPAQLNAKTDPNQLKALNEKVTVMETYFAEVDREVLNLVGRYGVPGMVHDGLRKPLTQDRQGHYSVTLWAKQPPSKDATKTISCYVWAFEGSRNVALNPSLWIGKKAHGMSFHWYINTGDKDLDKKIEKITINAANII